MNIKIGVSARHVHLSKEDASILFGDNYEFKKMKDLSQDNNYACYETVDILNGNNVIKNIRVVGPFRDKTQVEISKSDSYILKKDTKYRNSGDLKDAEIITIRGPLGEIERKSLIFASRHIHMNPLEAKKFGLNNMDTVKVQIDGEKGGILNNVYIRVSDNYNLELHLDLDDANAFNVTSDSIAKIVK